MKDRSVLVPAKVEAVKKIKEKVREAKIMIITNYSGMTVKQITELRRSMDALNVEYKVFKNTLINLTLGDEYADFKKLLTGPTAVLFGYGDAMAPTKALYKFVNENEKPAIVAGWFDNRFCDEAMLKQLSKLPSREELLSKLLGSLQSPIYGFANVLAGVLRKFVYALNAVKDKKGGES